MADIPFLIAAPRIGLERDLESWLLPNDAYPQIEDAYLFRGRIKKKQGYKLLGRLQRLFNDFNVGHNPGGTGGNNLFKLYGSIIGITNANPAVVTVSGAHNLTTGDMVTFSNVLGMTQINGQSASIIVISPNTFSVAIDSSAFGVYTSGGIYYSSRDNPFEPNAQFKVGSLVYTLHPTPNPDIVFTDQGNGILTSPTPGNSGTVFYVGGLFTTTTTAAPGTLASALFFYFPGLPVMGLPTLDQPSTNQSPAPGITMAFDTRYSYFFDDGTNSFVDVTFFKGTTTMFTWSGDDADFFWCYNYANALWTTNFVKGFQPNPKFVIPNQGDGIKWFDQDKSGWINYLPPINAAHNSFLGGALMMVSYKGRLMAFNTWEGTSYASLQNFPQRARWSQIGSPYYDANTPSGWTGGSGQIDAWNSDTPGFGGFIDAPTSENIVSCQFLKDTLVVYFQNSTWQLAYTGNELLPFLWVKINTELGALSTFSEVPFDKIVLGVGSVGIHACDTVNVERIDQKIPDEVFAIQGTNFGRERVYGIRDYYSQLVYWSIPYEGADVSGAIDDVRATLPPPGIDLIYPNRILAYNYIDQSYAFFNDSFTAFGYYSRGSAVTWANTTSQWQETFFKWVSPTSIPAFPFVAAGNQQGFVEIFDPELVTNSESLLVNNVVTVDPQTYTITSLSHNLFSGMVVGIKNNNSSYVFGVVEVLTADTFTWLLTTPDVFPGGTFVGNALIQVVPIFNVITKRFSPFIEEAMQNRISFIDIYVDRTANGEFQVAVYQDEDNSLPTNELTVSTFPESTYTNSPDTLPYKNAKLWKRVYMTQVAQEFQLQFTLNNDQLKNPDIAASNIVIHAIILWIAKAGRLTNS